jgi:hypothetical protein
MKKAAALSILSLGLASCLGLGGFKPESPDPMVWTDSVQHDFGNIPGTETVSHEFTVLNRGGTPLNITRVQTSCGCTAAVLGHQFLKPGESTKLKVTFDPRGRMGTQSRTVTIHSNDPKTPQKQLTISATMPAPVAAQPQVTTGAVTAPSSTTMAASSPVVTASPTSTLMAPSVPVTVKPVVTPVPASLKPPEKPVPSPAK